MTANIEPRHRDRAAQWVHEVGALGCASPPHECGGCEQCQRDQCRATDYAQALAYQEAQTNAAVFELRELLALAIGHLNDMDVEEGPARRFLDRLNPDLLAVLVAGKTGPSQ